MYNLVKIVNEKVEGYFPYAYFSYKTILHII